MKKIILYFLLSITTISQPIALENSILKTLDANGLFDAPIVDLLKIRRKIKDFFNGKLLWQGVNFTVQTTSKTPLDILCKRTEAIFGATFVVISTSHSDLNSLVTSEQKSTVDDFISQKHLLHDGVATGSFAIHPITGKELPIYVSNYVHGAFDMRSTHARLAIPAHDEHDFTFAHKHDLPIKLVVSAPEELIANDTVHGPIMHNKKLVEAYTGEYEQCITIHSDFLDNLTIKQARQKIEEYVVDNNIGTVKEYPLVYKFEGKEYSLKEFEAIETFINKQQSTFSESKINEMQQALKQLMTIAQTDFLDLVEQFLVNAKNNKELTIELIEESCEKRNKNDCYLLLWSQMNSNEPERVIFKRDIKTFSQLNHFCTGLIDFLGDFIETCTHALDNLKKLKNK